MTVQPAFCPLSLQTLFNMNGCAIVGGQIFFYDAGTTNPRTAYKDQGLTVATTFPVLTDAYGRIPPIWIGVGPYKIVLKDNYGGLISTIDNLPGGVTIAATPAAAAQFQTGMVIFEHGDAIYDGFLPLNANTIGNGNSTATGRANDDTNALFIHLWNKDQSLTVSGGRGISASADWSAAKTIALPDYRGRAVFGVDGMNAPLAGIFTAATTVTPNVIGTKIGSEAEALTQAQLPAVSPAITVDAGGGGTFAGTTDSQGNHSHTGTTDNPGDHSHNYNQSNSPNSGSGAGATSNSGTFNQLTSAAGNHTHNVTTNVTGAHTHATSTVLAPHAHTAKIAPLGSGAVHSKMPPGVLGFWHIKL